MSSQPDLEQLQRRIGYQFKTPERLLLALTHRSFGNQNNERLEFLGDSIVNMVIAEYLYLHFEKAREGQLSRLRARMVKGVTLAEIGREFELGKYLRLGSGEMKSGGFRRESILADAVESIIGAIYLDSDFHTCREQVLRWFEVRFRSWICRIPRKTPKPGSRSTCSHGSFRCLAMTSFPWMVKPTPRRSMFPVPCHHLTEKRPARAIAVESPSSRPPAMPLSNWVWRMTDE